MGRVGGVTYQEIAEGDRIINLYCSLLFFSPILFYYQLRLRLRLRLHIRVSLSVILFRIRLQ